MRRTNILVLQRKLRNRVALILPCILVNIALSSFMLSAISFSDWNMPLVSADTTLCFAFNIACMHNSSGLGNNPDFLRSIVMSTSVCVCVCSSVCLCVCPLEYIRNHTRDLYQFCACCLWPWLGPPSAGDEIPRGRGIFGDFIPQW